MEKILEKITRYNLFNNLLPGIIFIFLIRETTKLEFILNIGSNIFDYLFIAYFIGLVISRFGSLIIEPSLRKIKFITFSDYKSYLEAVKKDKKIEIINEENNSYRSYISLFTLFFIFHVVIFTINCFDLNVENMIFYISIILFILFVFSYKKQTDYIRGRINKVIKR